MRFMRCLPRSAPSAPVPSCTERRKMTMLEEIARALFMRAVERDVVDDTPEDWDALRSEFEADARAAVEALRKPTPAMLTAAFARQTREELIYEGVWRAMVDAILTEKPETK